GKLQQVGTPLEVYEQPANLFVASFIGTPPMNFIPATIADGGAAVVASGFKMPVPEALRTVTGSRDGLKVVAGLRPENIREAPRDGGGATVPLRAKVEFVEPLGHEVIVHRRVGDDLLVAKADPHRAPEMGSEIGLVAEVDALHLFDAATEQRLRGRPPPRRRAAGGLTATGAAGRLDIIRHRRTSMRKIFRGILCPLFLLLVFPMIGTAQKEIVIWHAYRGGEKAAFEKVIDQFNKSNKAGIKVTTLAVPYDAFAD